MSVNLRIDPARLVALRQARGWSITKLAKMAGVDYSSYWRIEKGQALNPRIETMQRIARALEVPVERLIAAEPADETPHNPVASGTLSADDATPQLADVSFFGLVSELGDLSDAERAAVLPILREIVSRRRAARGGRGARGRGGAAGP